METSELRDRILQNLKNEKDFSCMTNININGYYFSAVDVVLPCKVENYDIFRITVIKHNKSVV